MHLPTARTRTYVVFTFVLLLLSVAFSAAGREVAEPGAPNALEQPANVNCRSDFGKTDAVRVEWKDTNDNKADYKVYRKAVGDISWGNPWKIITDKVNKRWRVVDIAAGIDVYQYRVTAFDGNEETVPTAQETCREPLFLDSAEGNFRIFYRLEECPDYDDKDTCTEDVNVNGKNKHAAQALETSERYRSEITTHRGFNDPASLNGNEPFPLDFFPCNSGCAGKEDIQYPATGFVGADYSPISGTGSSWEIFVFGHEMFHETQNVHGDSSDPNYKWIKEGQARALEDKLCIFDQDECTVWDNIVDKWFFGEVNSYLGQPENSLLNASYKAALFWTYVMEQFAQTVTDEPGYGIDVILQFWKQNQANVAVHPKGESKSGIETLNQILANPIGSSRRFSDIFEDFAVANFAKDLITNPQNAQGKKYNYIDEENCPECAYVNVKRTISDTLSVGETIFGTSALQSWGARYFQVVLNPAIPLVNIAVDALPGTPHPLYYHVLGIKNDAIATHWSATGTEYALSVPNINFAYDRLVLIVVSHNSQSISDTASI